MRECDQFNNRFTICVGFISLRLVNGKARGMQIEYCYLHAI